MHPISGEIATTYNEIDVPFAELPSREKLEETAVTGDNYEKGRAVVLLKQWDARGALSPTYPYPVQAWQVGDGPAWVILGGEVVVDYSIRFKTELGVDDVWVAGYANDVMAYIPSLRVLREGRYEGGGAMVYYGQPSPWGEDVEELIVREVHRQVESLR
jgi:hypothetical protein